ncbi:MAG TPA: gephyrin-like molybdotransferase receptor GlpR [Pseudonocardiaceae bacterium]|nr:gephyrin-like molybdotransferase receptor GlpR [Pseudonocardiaceae bacterium]
MTDRGRGLGVPSSLIFAALAAAWLIVLVPMVAKRRQEVVRTAEAALASRVLRRPDLPRAAPMHNREVFMIGERITEREPALNERRYRPGRGGYDPEVAAQVARAKYVFRQRVVVGLVVAAIATVVLALTVSSLLWWVHAALDVTVIGYLGYLRLQVQIEEEVRQRRAARSAGSRAGVAARSFSEEAPVEAAHQEIAPAEESSARSASSPASHPTAVALDLDDEDPMFDELKPSFEPRYRRAVGE